jgi:hypothetical protein
MVSRRDFKKAPPKSRDEARSCGRANETAITNDLVACVGARGLPESLCQDRNANAECDSKHRKSNDARNQREAFGC